MTKKVLMLQLVGQVDPSKSLDIIISDLLTESRITRSSGTTTYVIEFDYYKPEINIENVKKDSKEMTLAIIVGQMMVNSIDSGELDHLLN